MTIFQLFLIHVFGVQDLLKVCLLLPSSSPAYFLLKKIIVLTNRNHESEIIQM